jgi:predicted amino acid racemase
MLGFDFSLFCRIFPTMEQMLKLLSDIQENLEKDLGK